MGKLFLLSCLLLPLALLAAKPCRDGSTLPKEEREFSEKLTLSKRKIFCGRFSQAQRLAAMQYAASEEKYTCPDHAVMKVMEESGLSIAVKSRRQCEEIATPSHSAKRGK